MEITQANIADTLSARQMWTWQRALGPSTILVAIAVLGAAMGNPIGFLELVIAPVLLFVYTLHFGRLVSRTSTSKWPLVALFVPLLNFVVIARAAIKDGRVGSRVLSS